MAMDGLAELLSVCWTASGGLLGGLGEVLGVTLGPQMAAKSESSRKKCCSRGRRFQSFLNGCCVEDKQPWRPQSLHLSLGILYPRFQHRNKIFFVLGANMAP